mmetsp:Transcript_12936/g.23003  ORF Transcript_12936/g.23003 Transcript_12936/m.23003 type:complete len:205 (+) Transcript_12936:753-1367(+)
MQLSERTWIHQGSETIHAPCPPHIHLLQRRFESPQQCLGLVLGNRRYNEFETHTCTLDGEGLLKQGDRFDGLLLGVLLGVNVKVNVSECALKHSHGVGSTSSRVYAFFGENTRNVLEDVLELSLALLVGDLELAVAQDLEGNFGLVYRAKGGLELLVLGHHTLGHVVEDRRRLEDLVEVFFDSSTPIADFVPITRNFKALAIPF